MDKVVSLLQCQLSEGAVPDNLEDALKNGVDVGGLDEEVEEGELPASHGKYLFTLLDVIKFRVMNIYDILKYANTSREHSVKLLDSLDFS